MRFLARYGVLIGEGAMVVYLAARIKMGKGQIGLAELRYRCSARQSEQYQKRAVQFLGRFCADAANNPPNTVAAERDQLVRHDLRPKAKSIFRCNFDQRPEQKSVLQV
jgi:hypothetical protein